MNDAYWDMISELPSELLDEDEYNRMQAVEAEEDEKERQRDRLVRP